VNNAAIAQISRIEDYLKEREYAAIDICDFDRQRSCFQALLIMRMVAGDERYTLASIMEVE
jgi:hypothetical protein